MLKIILGITRVERFICPPFDTSVKAPSYLQITNVVKSDSGTFVCVTSNGHGRVNCTVRLIVEGKSFLMNLTENVKFNI